MGNCLRRQSSAQWAGDDWGTSARDDDDETGRDTCEYEGMMDIEEKGLIGNHQKIGFTTSSSPTTTHEVKVKITKKQLEELLGRVVVKELSVQQVLAQLITVSNQYETNQRSWRPALQSIPEIVSHYADFQVGFQTFLTHLTTKDCDNDITGTKMKV
ncbi:uncharacterized protein LOC111288861 [Durio zibethinus]|uniref:Uncharacterized protein LOC111288861 n=1 Tax=Durio zibethinus TaxID=66656 RepID=A0A6P5Y562_DURZI|nr:uncharacterized protein LOC111288861 [Durio zibethinus]